MGLLYFFVRSKSIFALFCAYLLLRIEIFGIFSPKQLPEKIEFLQKRAIKKISFLLFLALFCLFLWV